MRAASARRRSSGAIGCGCSRRPHRASTLHIDGHVAAMGRSGDWFALDDPSARAGSRYAFAVDGGAPVPDPGSRFQPDGVHAASEIVAPDFAWPDDGWRGRPWHEHVIYELHVGTFTFEGTYEAASRKLRELVALGVTAIELMPLGAFPGRRNWGYDGVLPYAPFAGYGRPDDLTALHRRRARARPRGAARRRLQPLRPRRQLPARARAGVLHRARAHAVGRGASTVGVPDVRAFFAENAAYWLADFRFDGLRLDATHAIVDADCAGVPARGARDRAGRLRAGTAGGARRRERTQRRHAARRRLRRAVERRHAPRGARARHRRNAATIATTHRSGRLLGAR